jgi:hypothetical protein
MSSNTKCPNVAATVRTLRLGPGQQVTDGLIEVLAEHFGEPPEELTSLYPSVDTDALEALFAPNSCEESKFAGSLAFTYRGKTVHLNTSHRSPIESEYRIIHVTVA